MLTLGEKIRVRRKELGLTLRELSGKLSISPSTLQKIEKGVLSPTVNLMLEICHQLDKPMYSFIKDKRQVVVHIKKEDQKELPSHKGLVAKLIADFGLLSDYINISYVTCKKGGGIKKHTEAYFVFSYVLKGVIRINFSNGTYEVKAGEAIYYDGSFPHKTEALTDMELINLYIAKTD